MNTNPPVLLGVLGGLGPMSTVYFCELLTAHTAAERDSDHIDMLISSRASTPDRTAFILDNTQPDPLPVMTEEARRLERAGVDLIVIPCNTAHYFYNGLCQAVKTPMLNIIRETLSHLQKRGIRRFGLLATEGTVRSGAYTSLCPDFGLECVLPTEEEQAVITSLIYDRIKQNRPADMAAFFSVTNALAARGCEILVLGCTELSLLPKHNLNGRYFVDSLEVLAYRTIVACHKTPVGFDRTFMEAET